MDKNPTWFRSWMLLDALFHCKEGYVGLHNKCKELISIKLLFKVDKNPTWFRSWMLLDALFHCKEGYVGLLLNNVMILLVVKRKLTKY